MFCLSATNPSFIALLRDTRVRSCKHSSHQLAWCETLSAEDAGGTLEWEGALSPDSRVLLLASSSVHGSLMWLAHLCSELVEFTALLTTREVDIIFNWKKWDSKIWNREHLLGPRWNWPYGTPKPPWALAMAAVCPPVSEEPGYPLLKSPVKPSAGADDVKSTAPVCSSWWVGSASVFVPAFVFCLNIKVGNGYILEFPFTPCKWKEWKQSCSVVSNSLRPHGP